MNIFKTFGIMNGTHKFAVDTQILRGILERGCIYIDKTALVYKMTHELKYVFLSRPRRFGKSLLCNTLKEYFNGNKELFKGLQIYDLEKEWVKYPVIDLSFTNAKNVSEASITEMISYMLSEYEKKFGVAREDDDSGIRLENLIKNVATKMGQNVVVIIDEYDAAMLDTIDNDELQDRVRAIQNNFFSPLKKLDDYIRFVFITGITKFSQMSIFSALNNLKDISMWPEYEYICGISMEEFLTVLKPDIQAFADKNGYTFDETVRKFKKKYVGYHFSIELREVFNPYSVLNALLEKMLNDYWFNSGTPTSLIKLIRKFNVKMEDFDGTKARSSRFCQPVEKVTDLVPFLFQAGYLTIKNYNRRRDIYTLGYPNGEVKSAFAESLFRFNYHYEDGNIRLLEAYQDFEDFDDLDKFMEAMKRFFRRFPYSLNNMNERHYHSILYTVLASFGADISANVETALGKSDLILRMPNTIYVIELKYDHSTESALDQIDDRDYIAATLDDDRRIVKLAIKFSSKDRNVEAYEAVEVKDL